MTMRVLLRASILVVALVLALQSCLPKKEVPEEWKSYVCYDAHLVCLEYQKERIKPYVPDRESAPKYTNIIYFRRIKGVSDEQFIYAHRSDFPFASAGDFVFQNPEQYVNVLEEWTVERIELRKVKNSRDPEIYVIAVTDRADVATALKDFVRSADDAPGYSDERYHGYVEEGHPVFPWHIRAYFHESDAIAWDAQVWIYYLEEGEDRRIYIDGEREVAEDLFRNPTHALLPEDSALSAWLCDVLEEITAKTPSDP